MNIVRGFGAVKKVRGEFPSSFQEGFRVTVTVDALLMTGERSQLSRRLIRLVRSYQLEG